MRDTERKTDCNKGCQIISLPDMARPVGPVQRVWQLRRRLQRILKRRWRYVKNLATRDQSVYLVSGGENDSPQNKGLQPGDTVRVRSREQIEATLDNWNRLRGCTFMEEMWSYCGSHHRVLKPVHMFLDERDYTVKRCKGVYLLEKAICSGTRDYGRCDRSCFFFWREEWLAKE
jgi:hypothetical protein